MDVPRLRQLRQQAVLSQEQLAQKSGVARDTISKLEMGHRKAYPTTIRRLAFGLEIEPGELISYEDLNQPGPEEETVREEDLPEDRPNKIGF
jgi:transcriptional regulator with XRE-family HTH domain